MCVCHMAGCVSGCVRVQLCCEKQREEHDRDGERVCVSVCVVAVGGDGGAGVMPVMQLTALIQTPTSAGHPAASASLINTTDKDRLLLGCEEEWYGASNRMSVCACVCVFLAHKVARIPPQGECGRRDANLQGFCANTLIICTVWFGVKSQAWSHAPDEVCRQIKLPVFEP